MQLLPDPSLKLSPGNFNAHVDGKGLNLPSPLFGRLRDCNIHTAEQFVAMCQSAPLSLAMVLDWSLECVEPALKALTATLEGHVSSAILHPGPPVDYPLDPDCTRREDDDDRTWTPASLESDHSFLERLMVNYIRHALTTYDAKLDAVSRARDGGLEAAQLVKARVFQRITEVYPELAEEAARQQRRRCASPTETDGTAKLPQKDA